MKDNFFSDKNKKHDEDIDIFSDSSRMRQRNNSARKAPPKRSQNSYQKPVQMSASQRPPQRSKKDKDYDIYSNHRPVKMAKRKNPFKIFSKVFFSVFLSCLLLFAVSYGFIYNLFGTMSFDDSTNKENAYIDESELIGDSGVKNILLIGGDAREGEKNFRSDTMMLLSIDTNNNKIKLTSFLRDSWVEIPENGNNKLNASCTFGGPQLVIDTIEYNFHIKIDNYALVNFEAFKDIIDALGGVEVSVTEREANYLNRAYKSAGIRVDYGESVHLDGEQALAYCQIRKLDSDFFRTQRQRKVMSAITTKASQASPTTVLKVVEKILPYVQTDIKRSDMMKLSLKAATKYLKYDIVEMNIPGGRTDTTPQQLITWKDKYISGQSVLVFDIEDAREILHAFIYE